MNIEETEKYEMLKKISLYDVFKIFLKYEDVKNNEEIVVEEPKETYYTSKDLINIYPQFFSTYKIRQYISNGTIPYINDGARKIFLKSHIDKFIEDKTTESLFRGV